jgi:hypothetical protein
MRKTKVNFSRYHSIIDKHKVYHRLYFCGVWTPFLRINNIW